MDLRHHAARFGNYSEGKFDEGRIVGRELVLSSCDAPTLLNHVEEPIDLASRDADMGQANGRLLFRLSVTLRSR
jgi:hypothetical protein